MMNSSMRFARSEDVALRRFPSATAATSSNAVARHLILRFTPPFPQGEGGGSTRNDAGPDGILRFARDDMDEQRGPATSASNGDVADDRFIPGVKRSSPMASVSNYSTSGVRLASCSGQMAVELAVMLPVVIVVALISYNVLRFAAACGRFDRAALDCVVSQGVSPPGSSASLSAASEVQAALREAMGDDDLQVSVSERAGPLPHLTCFTCEFSMRPWPGEFAIAGVRLGAPHLLRHERSLTVDRYRPGVVLRGS